MVPDSVKHLLEQRFEEKHLEKRRVFLWGMVNDESAEYVVNRLLYLNEQDEEAPIYFYINSPGGVVTSGMVMYDTMQLIKAPVYTICMGLAASMGSILLSAGEKGHRYIWPHGRVMIHQPSIGRLIGPAADIAITAKELLRTKEMSAKILAQNCNKPYEQILKDFDRDYWMDAQEALDYGIVDHIIEKLL